MAGIGRGDAGQGGTLTLDQPPQLRPRVFRIQLSQLPQQLFRLLVAGHGHGDLYFYDLIPTHSILGSRRHALLAQPQLLPRLRPGRNLQHASAIDGGHLDFRSQSRFYRRHWHGDVDVVAFALKQGVLADADDDVEVADPASPQAGIAFARDANALPVAGSALNADLQRIGALDAAFAVARRAGRNVLARPMASGTGDVELHPAARLLDRPLAMTLKTLPRRLDEAIAAAVPADIAPGDIELHHAAANRRPEGHVDLVLQIAARLRAGLGCLATPAATEDAGENIAEPSA